MANQIRLTWNKPASVWVMDIADSLGVPIVQGIPLVTGCDLLDQYKYLDLGCQIIVQTDHDADAVPTFENLGLAGRVYVISP